MSTLRVGVGQLTYLVQGSRVEEFEKFAASNIYWNRQVETEQPTPHTLNSKP